MSWGSIVLFVIGGAISGCCLADLTRSDDRNKVIRAGFGLIATILTLILHVLSCIAFPGGLFA